MRTMGLAVLAMVATTGCTEESMRPAPTYAAPTADEAIAAYKAHMQAALGEEVDPEAIVAKTGVTSGNVDAYENAKDTVANNRVVHGIIDTMQKTTADRCSWMLFDARRFDRWTGPAIDPAKAPPYAWWCTVEVTVDNPERGEEAARTNAYLFRQDDGSWRYFGESVSGWKPTSGEG